MVAIRSFGTLVQIGDGATPTEQFTTIPGVKDISGPEQTNDTEDVTAHDSPGRSEELIATILRTGEISFPINWDPSDTVHQTLHTLKNTGEARNFRIIWPAETGMQSTFEALVTSFGPSAPVVGVLGSDITLKPTGPVTLEEVES